MPPSLYLNDYTHPQYQINDDYYNDHNEYQGIISKKPKFQPSLTTRFHTLQTCSAASLSHPPPPHSPTGSKTRLRFRDHVTRYKRKLSSLNLITDHEDTFPDLDPNPGSDAMRLVQLLISCAEAVACRDRVQAGVLLSELRARALVLGTAFQRVASCFVQGLSDRLCLLHPLGAVGVLVAPVSDGGSDRRGEEALALAYDLCPYIKFGHFVANTSIIEAFEGESSVHVVDLGLSLGLRRGEQWRTLLQSLAHRTSLPIRRVRITGVGTCAEKLESIGESLTSYARNLGVPFEFKSILKSFENLSTADFGIEEGEAVAVSSVLQLHCVVKESRGALNSVLQMIHEIGPRVMVLVEQDSSHNGPFFLGRFMEALHYYSAIFDAMDAALPRYDTKRAKVEQFYFAEEIKNIVSCEGPARVERHERVDQWRRRMSRAGFQAQPIKMVNQAKSWMAGIDACEGYTITEEKGCLVLGWKNKPIIAASCWKC